MEKPLTILVVTETWPPEINGVSLTVAGYVEGLRARDMAVHVLRPRQATGPDGDGDPFQHLVSGIRLPMYDGLQFGLATPGKVGGILERVCPSVIYIATEGPLGVAAMRAARQRGIPVITGFHTNFHEFVRHYHLGMLSGMVLAWLRNFHNKAAATIVATESLRTTLVGMGIRNPEYLPRGVDTVRFSPEHRDDELRRSWGANDDTPVVLYVGRIAAEKNLDIVMRAFRVFTSFRPDARLVFVGDGPMREGLGGRYPEIIHCGMQTGSALAAHYASGDILLFPSLTETFGNITLEGMASGLAVVAFDYAAAHHAIEHGVNGILAPFGEEGAYITRAAMLAHEPGLVSQIRRRARETVLAQDPPHAHDALARMVRNHALELSDVAA